MSYLNCKCYHEQHRDCWNVHACGCNHDRSRKRRINVQVLARRLPGTNPCRCEECRNGTWMQPSNHYIKHRCEGAAAMIVPRADLIMLDGCQSMHPDLALCVSCGALYRAMGYQVEAIV